jgi:tRNA wybutosine-synthesizing protein 5
MRVVEIPRVRVTPHEFFTDFSTKDCPVILEGLNWGSCSEKWDDVEYLARAVGPSPVKIHVSSERDLDFVSKNFAYDTMPFDQLALAAAESISQGETGDVRGPKKFYYLRALGNDPRGREVADFGTHFPAIAGDFCVPDGLYPRDRHFSSVFRISSAGLQLWTHYDVMDNILVQVRL